MSSNTIYLGLGQCPAGISFAGYGTPSHQDEIKNQDLLITTGPFKGLVGDTRFLDPLTQDYQYSSEGRIAGGIGIQQLVYTRLFTVLKSSAVTTLGNNLGKIKVIGSNINQIVNSEINNALNDLVKANKIKINEIIVNKTGTRLTIDVKWTDLTRNISLTTSVF